ncbi:MAG: ATP-binding protein [Ruminococcus sp.]|nr:ATP-binding protein [Ruminococcus sp.]
MDNDIIAQAELILTQRRNSAFAENERRVSEINRRIPQIREINERLSAAGRELIGLISAKDGKDVSERIEALRNDNLGAQAMSRQLLAANGYPEDYLDVHYVCPVCRDTGYAGGRYCECFKQLCGKLSAEELNKKTQLGTAGFDSFSLSYYQGDDYRIMDNILRFARNYAETFTRNSGSILMLGRTGLGKTHLSLAIADTVMKKGYGVIYDSAVNILRSIEREHFSREHSTETIDLIMDCDLLILDDLGTEYESSFYSSTIYNIINTRLNRSKPTIISTNLDFEGIARRYDERVVSRLTSVYTCLQFSGEDVRLQKKRMSRK